MKLESIMESDRSVYLLGGDAKVTSLSFSAEAALLLVGDTRGRLHLFKAQPQLAHWVSFVSHSTFFDRDSQSTESEHVAAAQFVSALPHSLTCLCANEKTIKLWSVGQHDGKSRLRRLFPPMHDFRIHSLSVHPARDQFLACDDLILTLCHFDNPATAFTLADLRPRRIEDLQEVLLFASFHPLQTHLLVYTSTAGAIRIADLRVRACAFPPALELRNHSRGGLTDLLYSISGVSFSSNENVLFSRQIQSVAIWDLRSPLEPLDCSLVLANERRLLADGDTPKFQVAALGERGWVTGGMDGNLVFMREFGHKEEVDLHLDRVSVPFVVSNSEYSEVFAGAKGQVMTFCEDIRNPFIP